MSYNSVSHLFATFEFYFHFYTQHPFIISFHFLSFLSLFSLCFFHFISFAPTWFLLHADPRSLLLLSCQDHCHLPPRIQISTRRKRKVEGRNKMKVLVWRKRIIKNYLNLLYNLIPMNCRYLFFFQKNWNIYDFILIVTVRSFYQDFFQSQIHLFFHFYTALPSNILHLCLLPISPLLLVLRHLIPTFHFSFSSCTYLYFRREVAVVLAW